MAYILYDKYASEYQQLWDTMHIIRDTPELQRLSDKINKYQSTYLEVEKATGVPWQMVAVIHLREAGESDIGKWKGVLHNGEKIVGTGRKTRLVPAGRGPFNTWPEAAVDALRLQGFDKIKSWPVSRMLWALEPYNGYGYRNKGLRSPYLWASTNHQQPGKYVADHVFDATVMDSQVGCAALLKFLGVTVAPKVSVPTTTKQTPPSTKTENTGFIALIAASIGAIYQWGLEHPWYVGGSIAAVLVLWALYKHGKHINAK